METHVDFASINDLFKRAASKGRFFLYEYEVYDLIRFVGSETPPRYEFLAKDQRFKAEMLNVFPGNKIVLKIVSSQILHKSEVGGVCIVEKDPRQVLSAIRRMRYEIPERMAGLIESEAIMKPAVYSDLKGQALRDAISGDIKGVILVQYMAPDSSEFGNELLVSLRWTREFGMIISAGLGGTDTELYAKRFRKGQAVVAANTALTDGQAFFELFRQTISYRKIAGLTRGRKRIVTDDQLLECFSALVQTGNQFSPVNPEAEFHIEELEINPFAFCDYLMLPLDGLCKFDPYRKPIDPRPVEKIDCLLHPTSIGIVGVSAKSANIGRIILDNVIATGFSMSKITLIHPGLNDLDGVRVIPRLVDLKEKVDLLILAVSATAIKQLVEDILEHDLANSVLLIPGGMGEKKGKERLTAEIKQKIRESRKKNEGPVFVGGNSLGILSHPGKYDAMFIPEKKLPKTRGEHIRKTALISQSGAYMITRMSKLSFLDPAYAVSIGNQIDVTASDILRFMNTLDDIKTVSFYIEGFCDEDGLVFTKAVKEAIPKGKEVILYKAGRTPEGKNATSGHTASIAGDYMVCESCVSQAGAIVAEDFTQFEGLLRLSSTMSDKLVTGNRLAAISNAGYESVGIADNILGEDYQLELAELSQTTHDLLEEVIKTAHLDSLVDVENPIDVTPMAGEGVYESSIRVLLNDKNVDAVIAAIVPLTPILHTLENEAEDFDFTSEKNLIKRISRLAADTTKPLVMVVDSGPLFDPLANALQHSGLPVFRSADRAVSALGKYIDGRLRMSKILDRLIA